MNDWDDAERRVEKAQELFEQHRWSEALEELRAATSINPYNGSWFFNIGLTLDEMGRFDEAIEAYRQSLDIEPQDLQALNHLGIDLHRVGNFDEALKTFARIESIDPSFEPSYCHRIITYSEQGDHEKAEEMFYLARLYKEHCPNCYYNIGCSLYDRGLFEKAIYCWQKTLDLDDSHPAVQVRIAEAFWGKGEPEAARQHYLIGLRQDPGNTDILLDLGDLLMEMGRTEEAGEKFRRAIELAPEEPAGYFCHGQWLMRQLSPQRDEQALLAFTKVLQLDPTYPGAHLRLGELHHRRHELQPRASTSGRNWSFGRRIPKSCWTCPTCCWTPARLARLWPALSGWCRSIPRTSMPGRTWRWLNSWSADTMRASPVARKPCIATPAAPHRYTTWRWPASTSSATTMPPIGSARAWTAGRTICRCKSWSCGCAF